LPFKGVLFALEISDPLEISSLSLAHRAQFLVAKVLTIVKIHRVNPRTGEVRSARGTGGCENDHRWLNDLLDMPSVGIARAERVIDDFYKMSNDRKMVNRLGMKEQPTHRTDKLLFLNSLAKSCGFEDAQLPFDVSYPPSSPVQEHMGLNFELPDEFRLPPSEEQPTATDVGRFQFSEGKEGEEEGVSDMAQFLDGIDFDDDDTPVDEMQFTPRDDAMTEAEMDSRLDEEGTGLLEDVDANVFAAFEEEVAAALPKIADNETTMQAWERLTQQRPVVPFKNPRLP